MVLLEEIFKFKGDLVEADEVIATVGGIGPMGGTSLHFKIRHHGKPLDSMEWIRKGYKGVN
jgi:septal ring factor EnvC (AmiA/AmiB activator)